MRIGIGINCGECEAKRRNLGIDESWLLEMFESRPDFDQTCQTSAAKLGRNITVSTASTTALTSSSTSIVEQLYIRDETPK